MFFKLKVFAKDEKALKSFLSFFLDLQKTSSTCHVVSSFNNRKVITVLKSPHVNKTAQEQFEYRIYSKKIFVHSYKPYMFLLTLKKLKSLCFPGVSLKITAVSNFLNKFKNTPFLFLPNNYNVLLDKEFLKFVQLFDCHGEMLLQTKYT